MAHYFSVVNQDVLLAQVKKELLLGGEVVRMDGPLEDSVVVRRQETLPDGVGVGRRPESSRDSCGTACIGRGGEGDGLRQAFLWDLMYFGAAILFILVRSCLLHGACLLGCVLCQRIAASTSVD